MRLVRSNVSNYCQISVFCRYVTGVPKSLIPPAMNMTPSDPKKFKELPADSICQSSVRIESDEQSLDGASMSAEATMTLNRHRQAAADFANSHAAPVAICRRPPGEFGLSEQPYLNLFLDDVGKLFASGGIDTVIEIVYPAKDGVAGRVVDIEETHQRIDEAIKSKLTSEQAEELRRYFGLDGGQAAQDPQEADTTAKALQGLASGQLDLGDFLAQHREVSNPGIDPEILRALRSPKKRSPLAEP